ncbi:hypothetical protein [Magnetospirillum sulfuroxidans]|uniref:Uncharacterized protein n=1 Tax=Magnetospirillum sulfuroxidans TaxID=611300 RepID=A0ABS5IES8_9PROT|nr:hypothetical protein [Magnetospirillum sulfuroxidans]MBR9972909.1 hypothetical protein [Magnetospirillum sulfuroxidans]
MLTTLFKKALIIPGLLFLSACETMDVGSVGSWFGSDKPASTQVMVSRPAMPPALQSKRIPARPEDLNHFDPIQAAVADAWAQAQFGRFDLAMNEIKTKLSTGGEANPELVARAYAGIATLALKAGDLNAARAAAAEALSRIKHPGAAMPPGMILPVCVYQRLGQHRPSANCPRGDDNLATAMAR